MLRSAIVLVSFALCHVAHSEVPAAMRRDFVTARNHIPMRWNPAGYWASPAGAFIGGGSSKDVCAAHTQTELSRGKIPSGFSFLVNSTGQFIASDRPLSKLPSAPVSAPPPVVSAASPVVPPPAPPKPAPPGKAMPMPAPAAPVASRRAPLPPAPPPSAVSMAPQIPIEPLRRTSGSTQVRRAAVVIDENAPPPVMSKPAPEIAVAMREAVLDPVHPRPLPRPAVDAPASPARAPLPPAPPPAPAAAAGEGGIPADMQKSYLSRHDSVFMVYDRDGKKWKSSEGAVPAGSADEWCRTATEIDRRAQRIPEHFSYKHVGKGQLEVTKD